MTEEVEILVNEDDGKKTTGTKRIELLQMAKGEYVVFVDDDDIVSSDYVESILKAIDSSPDAVGISGFFIRNTRVSRAEYSIHNEWNTTPNLETRPINHLCPVKREIAIQAGFPDIFRGEDRAYAERLKPLLKTEVRIDKEIYNYIIRPYTLDKYLRNH